MLGKIVVVSGLPTALVYCLVEAYRSTARIDGIEWTCLAVSIPLAAWAARVLWVDDCLISLAGFLVYWAAWLGSIALVYWTLFTAPLIGLWAGSAFVGSIFLLLALCAWSWWE